MEFAFYRMLFVLWKDCSNHRSAKHASSSTPDVWIKNPPSFLLRPLQEDCNLDSE